MSVALFTTATRGKLWTPDPDDEGVPVTIIGIERRGDGQLLALVIDEDGIGHDEDFHNVEFTELAAKR